MQIVRSYIEVGENDNKISLNKENDFTKFFVFHRVLEKNKIKIPKCLSEFPSKKQRANPS